ncbi:MAG: hypothetical protein MZV63_10720 [Marinilabiliales bacterium]|nr:hypothetical protein [Marinilabiliales bacterium]
MTFSAGLASDGLLPFCNIYSTFMQRAYDQVVHDVALQGLKVVFCIDRGGLVRTRRRNPSWLLRPGFYA